MCAAADAVAIFIRSLVSNDVDLVHEKFHDIVRADAVRREFVFIETYVVLSRVKLLPPNHMGSLTRWDSCGIEWRSWKPHESDSRASRESTGGIPPRDRWRDDRQGGKPVAEIRPLTETEALRPVGLAAGKFVVPDDFDDPLPDEFLDAFEGDES
jgi:hypothetical protein